MTATYSAEVQQDGAYLSIYVPEVDRHTQARHLREAEAMARDLVAIMDDVDPGSFDLTLRVRVDTPGVKALIDEERRLRDEAARATSEASRAARAAARLLADTGMPLRDVAAVLGVSHQRVHQLIQETTRADAAAVARRVQTDVPAADVHWVSRVCLSEHYANAASSSRPKRRAAG